MVGKSIAVVAGGKTVGHQLSVASGQALVEALAGSQWDPVLFLIGQDGLLPNEPTSWLHGFDYVFPLLHGAGIHGLLSMLDIPVLGEGEVGAAAAIDKPLCKRLLAQAGLPVVPGLVFNRLTLAAKPREVATRIAREIGFPCFVKPARGTASVGASPVADLGSLMAALVRAATFDSRILVEPFLDARELEVAVVAGQPSLPGELIFRAEFHDHATKLSREGVELVIPAMLDAEGCDRIQAFACAAFESLDLEAVARVEFLVDRNSHQIFLNEVNPLPCFAPGAVFPRLWEASGVEIAGLVERLALAADARQRELFRTQRRFAETVSTAGAAR